MRDEAARVEVRGVHLIGKDVLLAHVEVRLRLRMRHVGVLRILNRTRGEPAVPQLHVSLLKPFIRQFVPGMLPVPLHAAKNSDELCSMSQVVC